MLNLIELFPCGLPIILHNVDYSLKEQDRVIQTCIELQRHCICSDNMFKICAEQYMDRLVEGQIRARDLFKNNNGENSGIS